MPPSETSPAVNQNLRACDEAGRWRRQEERKTFQILGGPDSADRYRGDHRFLYSRLFEPTASDVGDNESGRDRIDANIVRRKLESDVPHQIRRTGLCGM
jgi:hypothetical protein